MKKLSMAALSLAGVTGLAIVTVGMASAATPNNSTTDDIGTSGIARSTFKTDRLDAEAQVLNTTTANVQSAHKDKTFKQLLTNADLTPKTFHEKVKADLTTELESQGYTQDQITIALQHRDIARLHHHDKK